MHGIMSNPVMSCTLGCCGAICCSDRLSSAEHRIFPIPVYNPCTSSSSCLPSPCLIFIMVSSKANCCCRCCLGQSWASPAVKKQAICHENVLECTPPVYAPGSLRHACDMLGARNSTVAPGHAAGLGAALIASCLPRAKRVHYDHLNYQVKVLRF